MPNCYLCGRPLNESNWRKRRRVRTGEWVRTAYGKSRAQALQVRWGMRVVCAGCARRVDLRERDGEVRQWLVLGFWLLAFLALLILS